MAWIILGALVLAALAGTALRTRAPRAADIAATGLRMLALVLIVTGAAGTAVPQLLAESSPAWLFAVVVALPVVLAVLPLVLPRRLRARTTWACGLVLVVLAMLFGLGAGGYVLPGALVLLLAAGLSGGSTSRADPAER